MTTPSEPPTTPRASISQSSSRANLFQPMTPRDSRASVSQPPSSPTLTPRDSRGSVSQLPLSPTLPPLTPRDSRPSVSQPPPASPRASVSQSPMTPRDSRPSVSQTPRMSVAGPPMTPRDPRASMSRQSSKSVLGRDEDPATRPPALSISPQLIDSSRFQLNAQELVARLYLHSLVDGVIQDSERDILKCVIIAHLQDHVPSDQVSTKVWKLPSWLEDTGLPHDTIRTWMNGVAREFYELKDLPRKPPGLPENLAPLLAELLEESDANLNFVPSFARSVVVKFLPDMFMFNKRLTQLLAEIKPSGVPNLDSVRRWFKRTVELDLFWFVIRIMVISLITAAFHTFQLLTMLRLALCSVTQIPFLGYYLLEGVEWVMTHLGMIENNALSCSDAFASRSAVYVQVMLDAIFSRIPVMAFMWNNVFSRDAILGGVFHFICFVGISITIHSFLGSTMDKLQRKNVDLMLESSRFGTATRVARLKKSKTSPVNELRRTISQFMEE